MNIDLSKLLTERRNANSANIDTLSTEAMLTVINQEDLQVAHAITPYLAQIAQVFADYSVSIASMIQKGRGDEAELVLITHPTRERDFFAAIEKTNELICCKSKPMTLRVL